MEGKHVLALDIGTTTVRCYVLDNSTVALSSASDQVELLYPQLGHVEIDPEKLWASIIKVVRVAVSEAGINFNQVECLGISTQRCSFITWHRETGLPFHKFITWKDMRADGLVRQWNDSFTMKAMRIGARILYTISRNKRFLAGSVLQLMNPQVTLRLVWALKNISTLKDAVSTGQVLFGTLDTWLLYRLTLGCLHVTDYSNASATGLYDPFTRQWADWAFGLFDIPKNIFPEVWNTTADFGATDVSVFGAPVNIRSSIADQAASLFGSCCFNESDLKVTLGTGTFLNLNTGNSPHASVAGLYPVMGWKRNDEIVYIAEGAANDTGTVIIWAQQVGLITDVSESSRIANSVEDSGGVYFIPAFSGLQAPLNNQQAGTGFIGIKPTTRREHMVRAILESIVFRVVQLYRALQYEVGCSCHSVRVDGGVSRNDFVCQLLADLIGLVVERPVFTEMSALGAGFLAGLEQGVWKSKEELQSLRKLDHVFKPNMNVQKKYDSILSRWEEAVMRFNDWYPVPH